MSIPLMEIQTNVLNGDDYRYDTKSGEDEQRIFD